MVVVLHKQLRARLFQRVLHKIEIDDPGSGPITITLYGHLAPTVLSDGYGQLRGELFGVVFKSPAEVRQELLERGHDAVIAKESRDGGRVYVLLRDDVGGDTAVDHLDWLAGRQ